MHATTRSGILLVSGTAFQDTPNNNVDISQASVSCKRNEHEDKDADGKRDDGKCNTSIT